MDPSLFGVCPHDTAKGSERWALFNTLVNRRIGMKSRFTLYLDFGEFTRALEGNELLWAYLNPADFVKAKTRFGYQGIARPGAHPDKACVIAPAGAGTNGLTALAGKRLAAVRGYLFFLVADRLETEGIPYTLVPAKSYPEVMSIVKRGDADFGVTYNDHFEKLAPATQAEWERVESVDPGLAHVVAVHPSVSPETAEALRGFLLGATTDPDGQKALNTLGFSHFEAVPETPYMLLEELLANAAKS